MDKFLSLLLCFFMQMGITLLASELDDEIASVEETLNKLPKASLHESGSPMGFKSEWLHYHKAKRHLIIDLGEVLPVQQIVIVPALEPAPGGNRAHCFPKRLSVSISETEQSGFKEIREILRDESNIENPLPIIIDVEGQKLRYVKVDLLELLIQHYYALGEIFVFSKGRNVALHKKISTNCEQTKEGPHYLVDGLTSLGMPILAQKAEDHQYLWIGSLLAQQQKVSFDFTFTDEKQLDEIRLYSAWLPNHSRPDNLPGRFKFYYYSESQEGWQKFYERKRNFVIQVGDNPYAIQFPQVRSKKFRVEFLAVNNQKNDCNMSEIQLIDWSESITDEAIVTSSINKIKNVNLNRIAAMGDSQLRYGEIRPQQEWLNEIVLREELEQKLVLLHEQRDKNDAYVISLYKNTAFVIAAFLLIALIMIIKSRYDHHIHQEKLRSEIASDLHDEIGSNLACINLISEYLNQDDIAPEDLKENAREIMDITSETTAFMHDIVWMLDPNRKGTGEFKEHLEEITERLLRKIDFEIRFTHFERIESWPIDLIRNFILFYKEALNNLQKYSKADSVQVSMGFHSKIFHMTIQDNGEVPLKKAAPSLYLRAEKLGWDFQISHSDEKLNELSVKIRSSRHG